MSNLLVSVIVPIYNVEQYLNRCIKSITEQTYKDLEIILVDDGSTDKSSIICDKWSKKDARIRVIHKENGGLSSARNTGIEKANGRYLVFIDSDDRWLKKNFLEDCIHILEVTNDKVLLFGYQEISKNCIFVPKVDFSCVNDYYKNYDSKYCVKNNLFFSSAWTKIIEIDLIRNNNIYFRPHVHSEDVEWSAKILAVNNSYSIYPENVYGYYQNDNSITHNISDNDIIMLINNIKFCLKIAEKSNLIDKSPLYSYIAYQYITALNLFVRYSNEKNEVLLFLKENKILLNYHDNKKVYIIYKFNKYFGFSNMIKLLKLFLKISRNGR